MSLGVIPMICLGILRIFGEKSKKRKKLEIWAYRAPTPQRREPTLRCRPTPRCGMPRRGESEVPKWHPSGMPRRRKVTPQRRPTPQRSNATLRRSYCSQRAKFCIFFLKV